MPLKLSKQLSSTSAVRLPDPQERRFRLWTIAEAVEESCRSFLRPRSSENELTTRKESGRKSGLPLSGVSIVAVVVDVTVSQWRPGSDRHIGIWIRDMSLSSSSTRAYVSYWGSKATEHLNAREPTTVGDVILFNGLMLRQNDAGYHVNDDDAGLYEFRHSWLHPHTRPSWERVARVDSSGCADPLAPGTVTFPELHSLLQWCQATFANAPLGPHHDSPHIRAHCHERTLLEVHAAIGAVSNVVAKVTDVQLQRRSDSLRRKRPRWSRNRPSHEHHVFATLSDGSHTIPFFHADGRFRAVLEDALAHSKPVRLDRVKSQRCRDMVHQLTLESASADTVLLVPTCDTSVRILMDDEPVATTPGDTGPACSASLTQNSRRTVLVEAHIVSLIVGSVKLTTDSVSRNASLVVNSLTNDDSMDFSVPVSLTLTVGDEDDGVLDHMHMEGDLAVVRKLCGGIPSRALSSDNQLYRLATSILTASLHERVRHRWMLETTDDEGRRNVVVSVSLPRL